MFLGQLAVSAIAWLVPSIVLYYGFLYCFPTNKHDDDEMLVGYLVWRLVFDGTFSRDRLYPVTGSQYNAEIEIFFIGLVITWFSDIVLNKPPWKPHVTLSMLQVHVRFRQFHPLALWQLLRYQRLLFRTIAVELWGVPWCWRHWLIKKLRVDQTGHGCGLLCCYIKNITTLCMNCHSLLNYLVLQLVTQCVIYTWFQTLDHYCLL